MKTYKFTNGDIITSKLEPEELINRMRRLDTLRVLTEGYESGEGSNICRKALKAYNNSNNFTGIIHLTSSEKDFLGYLFEGMMTEEEKEVVTFYLRQKGTRLDSKIHNASQLQKNSQKISNNIKYTKNSKAK